MTSVNIQLTQLTYDYDPDLDNIGFEDLEYLNDLEIDNEVENVQDIEEFQDLEDLNDVQDLEDLNEVENDQDLEIDNEVEDLEETKKSKTKSTKDKNQYVNEHMLSVLMSVFRNYDGSAPKNIAYREEFKVARAKFEIAKAAYTQCIQEGNDKRSQKVQKAFIEMLELSKFVYPNDAEIAELFNMICLIAERCVLTFGGRNKGIDVDDISATSFERWLKYRHNFDPLKRSEISGQRVNAFAYMTQLVKNTVFEASNKIKRQRELEERLKGDILLYESLEHNESIEDEANLVETAQTVEVQYECSEIIKLLMERAHLFTDIKKLILSIVDEGFDLEHITGTIDEYNLYDPIKEVLIKKSWEF